MINSNSSSKLSLEDILDGETKVKEVKAEEKKPAKKTTTKKTAKKETK